MGVSSEKCHRCHMPLLHAIALGLCLMASARAEPPAEAPAEVAALLGQVQAAAAAGDRAGALAAIEGWRGPAHPLADLARGHAFALAERYDDAIGAYRGALAVDATLRPAGLGLIGALARAEQWAALCAELPRWHDPASADDKTMRLWLAAALGAEDALLAEEVARRGLVRWPGDGRFRRGLAHALLTSGRRDAAAAALRPLIAASPGDAELWMQLARASEGEAARLALEAAVLAEPADRRRRARLVEVLLAGGRADAALRYAGPLGATSLTVRAALAAGESARAAEWLAELPEGERDGRLAARVALANGDRVAARAALVALSTGGEADAAALVQLAALERAAGALGRAEALLRQAAARDDPHASAAVAHLAHVLLSRGRRQEAAGVLRRHLVRHPADETARALLALAEG